MSDPSARIGSAANPLRLDPWQTVVEFSSGGGGVGLLRIDGPLAIGRQNNRIEFIGGGEVLLSDPPTQNPFFTYTLNADGALQNVKQYAPGAIPDSDWTDFDVLLLSEPLTDITAGSLLYNVISTCTGIPQPQNIGPNGYEVDFTTGALVPVPYSWYFQVGDPPLSAADSAAAIKTWTTPYTRIASGPDGFGGIITCVQTYNFQSRFNYTQWFLINFAHWSKSKISSMILRSFAIDDVFLAPQTSRFTLQIFPAGTNGFTFGPGPLVSNSAPPRLTQARTARSGIAADLFRIARSGFG